MVSQDQKCHVAPFFDHFVISNALVPLMMTLASCNAVTGANGTI